VRQPAFLPTLQPLSQTLLTLTLSLSRARLPALCAMSFPAAVLLFHFSSQPKSADCSLFFSIVRKEISEKLKIIFNIINKNCVHNLYNENQIEKF